MKVLQEVVAMCLIMTVDNHPLLVVNCDSN